MVNAETCRSPLEIFFAYFYSPIFFQETPWFVGKKGKLKWGGSVVKDR